MSFSSLQSATLIAGHALATNVVLSFGLPLYQKLQTMGTKSEDAADDFVVSSYQDLKDTMAKMSSKAKTDGTLSFLDEFTIAQDDEVKYAGLLIPLLLYFSTYSEDISLAATLAVVGQLGDVWTRTFFGKYSIITLSMAALRIGSLGLLVTSLALQ